MADAVDSFGILVVDDDEAMADLTATHLSRLLPDATIRTEADPRTALSRLDAEPVDCLVSDYDMPEWTGLDLLEHVRAEYPELPFILFTGKGSEEIASEAISAGVTDYLQKRAGSDRFEVLANRITNAVTRRWAVREAEHLQQFTDVVRTTQRELVSVTTPAEACDAVCQSLTTAANYRGAWVGKYDEQHGSLHCCGSAGTVPDPVASEERIDVDVSGHPTTPLAASLAHHEPRQSRPNRRTSAENTRVSHTAAHETESPKSEPPKNGVDVIDAESELFSIPLVTGDDDLFGVLVVLADAGHVFSETERDRLTELSWTVAQAITTAQARQTLLDRERTLARYETIVDVLDDPVYALDETGRLTDVNDAFERLTGYDETALLGAQPSMLLSDSAVSTLQTVVESLLDDRDGRWTTHEMEVQTASGDVVHCEATIALLPADGDGFRGSVGVVRNVEDRVSAEGRLRENKRKIEAIHGFARTVGNCKTVEEVCQRTVEAADRILAFDVCYIGLRDGEYIIPKASRNIDTPHPVRHDEGIAGAVHHSGESSITREMKTDPEADPTDDALRSGMTIAVGDFGIFQAASFSPDDFSGRDLELAELLLSHVAEALKRVRYELELKDERDRVAALFENLPEPVAACHATPAGPVVDDVNSEFKRVFGYDRTEIVGENIDEHVVPEDDVAITLEETFYVGNTVQTEVRRRTKHGIRDFLVTIIPVDLDGFSTEGYVVYADISDQKRRERELSRQNERLAEFTSLVTHDLRNPLNVAMGNLELAKELEEFDRLDTAANALDRMESLIRDFLSLARQGRTVNDPTTLTLETVVQQAWRTVDTGPQATLDFDDLGVVIADAERLRTMFENLFRNAREHGDETTTVRVGRLTDGFFIEDDGPGIDEETREHIFEYGYSTESSGTGFGLAIVERIVQAHGWDISVTEGETGGARFEIRTE